MDKKMTVVELKELLDRTGGPMKFNFNPDECRPIKFTWTKIKTYKTGETHQKADYYDYNTHTWVYKEVPTIVRAKVGEEVRWAFGNEETGIPLYLNVGADRGGVWLQFDKNTQLLYVFLVALSHTTRKNCENAKYEHTTDEVFIVTQNHQIFKRTRYNDWCETKRIKSYYYSNYHNTIVQKNDVIYSVLSKMWGKDITSPQGTVFKTLDTKSCVHTYQVLSTIETKFRENNSAKSEEYIKQFNETADKLSINVKGEDICLDYSEKFGYFARYFTADKHEVCRFVYNKGKKQIFVWQNNKWNKSNARGTNLWYIRADRLYITERARQSDDSINCFVNNDNRLIFEGCYDSAIGGFMRNHKTLYEIYTTMLSLNIDRVNQHILHMGPNSIDCLFGEINDNAKTLWGKLGVNKHQFMRAFDGIERRYYPSDTQLSYYYHYPIKLLKTALKQQDIRYIDNNIFDKLVSQSNLEMIKYIGYPFNRDRFERAIEREITLDLLVKLSEHSYPYNTFTDYLDMRSQLQNHSVNISEFPIMPKDSELPTLHDREIIMLEDINNRDLNTKMVDAAKYASKFDFDDKESDFIITHPNTAGDVANEGLKLHHCVKSYTQRIANLQTTILFLRKRTDPDTPFYTINIERGRLVQIHGLCNCWLGCNPEAIPTVAKWLKKFKIQYDLADVLSTGTSYGGRSAKQVENIYGL